VSRPGRWRWVYFASVGPPDGPLLDAVGKGFARTTIDDIAEAANVSRRTFFRYYEQERPAPQRRL
jgi:Bacterial regulatory proteins, tetR family